MANKFFYENAAGTVSYDVSLRCEPKVHDAAPGFGIIDGSLFKGEGPFQKAGSNTENEDIRGYKVNSVACSAVKIGHYPVVTETCNNCFCSIKTPGTYTMTRSSTSLTIGSSSYSPSDFRNGVIPSEVIIFAVGGGGGGGGSGYYENEDKDYVRIAGGAGGGGGCIIARVDLTDYNATTYLVVGAGGAAGTNGSSSSISSGTAGGDGEWSGFDPGQAAALVATGGNGGKGGVGKEEDFSAGTGGAGGTARVNSTDQADLGVRKSGTVSGGTGCFYSNRTCSNISALTFNPYSGTGSSSVTIVKAKNRNSTCNHLENGGDAWYSGGSSFGEGAYYDGVGFFNYANGIGGGGGSGANLLCPGAAGGVFICY